MVDQIIFTGNSGTGRHAWNIGSHVGLGAPNKPEDVELVQFAYLMMSRNRRAVIPPALTEAPTGLRVGQRCEGTPDDPLVRIIRVHQQHRGGTQDGRVSPIKTTSGFYQEQGQHGYMLVVLNNNLLALTPFIYPRLDQHPECPGNLKKAILESYDLPGFLAAI